METALSILIADDETLSIEKLVHFLMLERPSWTPWVARDGAEALDLLRTHPKFHACFLDFDMPHLRGLDVVRRAQGGANDPAWILVTGHSAPAVEAYETGVLDYLVKPYTRARFRTALERVEGHVRSEERVVVTMGRTTRFVPLSEIEAFVSHDKGTWIVHAGEEYAIDGSVTFWEGKMSARPFLRVHRSACVNLLDIREFDAGASEVVLRSGARFPVSREGRSRLTTLLRTRWVSRG